MNGQELKAEIYAECDAARTAAWLEFEKRKLELLEASKKNYTVKEAWESNKNRTTEQECVKAWSALEKAWAYVKFASYRWKIYENHENNAYYKHMLLKIAKRRQRRVRLVMVAGKACLIACVTGALYAILECGM
jgi:hypothetical protein